MLVEQLEIGKLKSTKHPFRKEGLLDFLGIPKSD